MAPQSNEQPFRLPAPARRVIQDPLVRPTSYPARPVQAGPVQVGAIDVVRPSVYDSPQGAARASRAIHYGPPRGVAPMVVPAQAFARVRSAVPLRPSAFVLQDSALEEISPPARNTRPQGINPPVLNDPWSPPVEMPVEGSDLAFLDHPRDAPNGYTGPSGILPLEQQTDAHFVPMEDRWRAGFPEWDRYERGFPIGEDYPYKRGRWWDPYNQNVLKGDYPIIGQHTFFKLEVFDLQIIEARQVPTATTPFESTLRPRQEEFFGNGSQFFYSQPLLVSFDLFHGDAGFKPFDWQVRLTPAFNVNVLDTAELAVVSPDVRKGTQRSRTHWTLEEWFVEAKLADIGPNYDFVSVRAGSQQFVSDFRGFLFNDVNRAIRLFGTLNSNREQFNLILFDQTEKETNSQLNTFDDRHQNTFILNYFRQDFIWPGYTAQLSLHYNHDQASRKFDQNGFLVRPDPAGVFRPHEVNAFYLGWAGDGHINRVNITHQAYVALGKDTLNPIAGKPQDIEAYFLACELSIDRDWARFRSSILWASGDENPNNGTANGFDSIFENPNFAGGEFSFWQRQAIQLFGVRLVNDRSLLPDLRSSRVQGQSNFVNPGVLLLNVGADADLTPKTKVIANANYLFFDRTETLELFTFQDNIRRAIGADLSIGFEHRPLLNDNIEILGGVSCLIPDQGFRDLYNPLRGRVHTLVAGFMEMILIY